MVQQTATMRLRRATEKLRGLTKRVCVSLFSSLVVVIVVFGALIVVRFVTSATGNRREK